MNNDQKRYTPEQKKEIIAGIRAGIAKVKHHKSYTALIGKAIQDALPAYRVFAGKDSIKIWGNGVDYGDGAVFLCWNWRTGLTWAECIEPAIQREDTSDYTERLADEQTLYPAFEQFNADVTRLLELVSQIRRAAQAGIAGLPVPKTATIRKEHYSWNRAQQATVDKFPNLFDKVNIE